MIDFDRLVSALIGALLLTGLLLIGVGYIILVYNFPLALLFVVVIAFFYWKDW